MDHEASFGHHYCIHLEVRTFILKFLFSVRTKTQQGVLADGTSRISCKGRQVYQFVGIGSFCEYTVVMDTSVTKIRDDAPLDKVCLLGCGVSTGYGAALNAAKVTLLMPHTLNVCYRGMEGLEHEPLLKAFD